MMIFYKVIFSFIGIQAHVFGILQGTDDQRDSSFLSAQQERWKNMQKTYSQYCDMNVL